MIDNILQILAPHHCYGCGQVGAVICTNCKYNITEEPFSGCIVCSRPSNVGICSKCQTSYEKAWCVGERVDALRQTIDGLKFERVRSSHKVLADLLNETLPILPQETRIVPIPTIASHVRQRGYDHTALIAHRFARLRNIKLDPVLMRATNSKQRGSNRKQRFKQAESAYICNSLLDPELPYLIIDDIVTTGATLQHAAKVLKDAGAKEVWVAVLARQPLGKK